MNSQCRQFRASLERCLIGRPSPSRLAELSWHEHLFACGECRRVLEVEEALETLLASLPEPHLSPVLRDRVLARLRAERRLDTLLALDEAVAPPADLARGVLARLAQERHAAADTRLDRLLELDRAAAPAGLAQRTLASLKLARRAAPRTPTVPRVPTLTRRSTGARVGWFAAAAAALVLAAWIWWPDRTAPTPGTPVVVEGPPGVEPDLVPIAPRGPVEVVQEPDPLVDPDAFVEAEPELLEVLDVLENWDLLMAGDVEILLATLPAADEALITALDEEG